MRTMLLTGWTLVRWLRLGLAVFLLWGALAHRDLVPGVVGALLLVQVAFNTGCCGAGGCTAPAASVPGTLPEIEYEEVQPAPPKNRT